MLVLGPIGLEELILVRIRMDAGPPFVIDFGMAGAAGLGCEARETLGNLLIGDHTGIIRAQSEDDDRLHFGLVKVDEPCHDHDADQHAYHPLHQFTLLCQSARAVRSGIGADTLCMVMDIATNHQ